MNAASPSLVTESVTMTPGFLCKKNGGDERDQAVAVDLLAVRGDGARAVDVGVEDDAEVRLVLLDRRADGLHRRLVFGVGNVVGEVSVRIQELRSRRVRAQGLQNEVDIEAARAVARVHKDALPGKGPVLPAGRAHLSSRGRRHTSRCTLFGEACPSRREVALRRNLQDVGDVAALQTAVLAEELEPVLLPRQVACRDHHGDVRAEIVLQQHEHGRRGGEPRSMTSPPQDSIPLCDELAQMLRREARVVPDGEDGRAFPVFAAAQTKNALAMAVTASSVSVTGSFGTPARAVPRTSVPLRKFRNSCSVIIPPRAMICARKNNAACPYGYIIPFRTAFFKGFSQKRILFPKKYCECHKVVI